jgi:prepilin-type N-terminal cleavage/methylation domain-containing protein
MSLARGKTVSPHRQPRRGYTLLELLVVMAILILFATLVLPSLNSFFGGNRPKAAADQVRGELAAARAWAMDEGVPYRVAVSADGTKIRRAPEAEFDQPAVESGSASARRAEQTFEKVVAEVLADDGTTPLKAEAGGWVTVAIVMPDGTCRDDREESDENGNQVVIVALREQLEPGKPPSAGAIHVTVRGITGQVQVAPAGKTQGQP